MSGLSRVSEWEVVDEPVVVLGAGGAARAVLIALIESGSSEIRLVNRNQIRAAYLFLVALLT